MLVRSTSVRRQDARRNPYVPCQWQFLLLKWMSGLNSELTSKFCVKLDKTATETLQLLRDATAVKLYLGLQ
jgi:hypothetical protein